jgi:hypothetical protein
LILVGVYSWLVGNVFHVAVHIVLLGLIGHLVLQTAMLIDPALPFSRPTQKGRNPLILMIFLVVTAMVSTSLDAFSSVLYSSVAATLAAFAVVAAASAGVDRLTRARVERDVRSLEFEG